MRIGPEFNEAKLESLANRTLESRDLGFRPFRLTDIDQNYCRWMHDEEVVRFTRVPTYDRSIDGLRAYAERVMTTPGSFFWSVVHREDHHNIGTAKLVIDIEHGIANWGYLIGERDYWRDGITIQAQIPVLDFAFFEAGVRKMHGSTYSDHVKSRFNLARMEFRKEGVLREHFRRGSKGEEIVDLVSYGMLADEWSRVSPKFDYLRYDH